MNARTRRALLDPSPARALLLVGWGLLLAAGCQSDEAAGPEPGADTTSLLDRPWHVVSLAQRDPEAARHDGERIDVSSAITWHEADVDGPPALPGEPLDRPRGHWSIELPPVDPARIDSVTFRYRGVFGGWLVVRWWPRDGGDGPAREMAVEVAGKNRWQTCSVRLGNVVPRGRTAGRLDVHPPALETSDAALARVFVQLTGAVSPARVEVDRQDRRSLVLQPDVGVAWTVEVPPQGRLLFHYAVREEAWTGGGDGSSFRLDVVSPDRGLQTLWHDTLAPGRDSRDRHWLAADVDLAAFAGSKVELRLVAEASPPVREPFHPRHDVTGDRPVVAAPRLVGSPRPGPNVILISLDTLRGDHLGLTRNGRAVSPRLDAMADEAVVFRQAYATGPWTHPSTGTILTGLLPNEHQLGASAEGPHAFRPGITMLAERLAAAGYATAAVSNNRIVTPAEGFARGFDLFDTRSLEDDEYYGAERVTAQALQRLAEPQGGPFFLYLHYFDPHDPYQAPPPFTRRFVPAALADRVQAEDVQNGRLRRNLTLSRWERPPQDEVDLLHRLYDGEIGYLDHWIGVLVDSLAARGLLANTSIVWVGDHGEEFLERGTLQHQQHLYNELIHVPMMMRFADGTAHGGTVDSTVSLMDVVPTVLGLCGVPGPVGAWPLGRDLHALLAAGRWENLPAYAISYGQRGRAWNRPEFGPKRAVVDGRWKYIWSEGGAEELYDLRVDPGERHDVGADHDDVVRRLRWLADAVLAVPEDATSSPPANEQLRQKLEALGYVD